MGKRGPNPHTPPHLIAHVRKACLTSLHASTRRHASAPQAQYSPSRGEFNRRDTGILSDNTAGVNMASPDFTAHPRLKHALRWPENCTLRLLLGCETAPIS